MDRKSDERPFFINKQTDELLKNNLSTESYENIQSIFKKNEVLKQEADLKHEEIQTRFKELKERLALNAKYLEALKNHMDNVEFDFQKKIVENQGAFKPDDFFDSETERDMTKRIEVIKAKLDSLKNSNLRKIDETPAGFKEAFTNVSRIFDDIQSGAYSSNK